VALERAAGDEDRQPPEEPALLVGEELVAPGDRRAQRLLAGVRVPSSLEQVQPTAQPAKELIRREEWRPSRRQLEREGQLVQAVAKVDDGRRALELHAESCASLEEELNGVVLFERRHRVDVLTLEL